MMTFDIRNTDPIIEVLRNALSKKRFQHVMRVAKLSKDLAVIYGEDPEKAYFAGLTHDLAKELDDDTCRALIDEAGIEKDPCIIDSPNLAHGEIAAYLLKRDYGIVDEAILNAVRWHTYGRAHMTTLDKIVYLADVIEPKRDFENIDTLRAMSKKNLDQAIHYFFDLCIAYLSGKSQKVHHNTYLMLKTLNN